MQFFLTTAITTVITFSLNPLYKAITRKTSGKKQPGFHIHHSVTGLLILIAGLTAGNGYVIAIGLGIYVAHGLEEIYFNKRRNWIKAFFILVTR